MNGFIADTIPRRALLVDPAETLGAGPIGIVAIKSTFLPTLPGVKPTRVGGPPFIAEAALAAHEMPLAKAYQSWSVGLRAGLSTRRVAGNPVLMEVWERCLFLIRAEGRFGAVFGGDGQLPSEVLDDPGPMQELFAFCRSRFPEQLRAVERPLAAKHGPSAPLPDVGVHQILDGFWFPRWALDAENLYIHPDAE